MAYSSTKGEETNAKGPPDVRLGPEGRHDVVPVEEDRRPPPRDGGVGGPPVRGGIFHEGPDGGLAYPIHTGKGGCLGGRVG